MRTERPTCRECACTKVCEYFKNENDSNLDETCPLCYWEKYFVPKQEWIRVDERLPEDTIPDDYKHKTIKVLVAIRGKNGVTIRTQQRFLDYAYRDDKRTAFWTWRFSGGDVTHWMPLPEAPKMKGGAE